MLLALSSKILEKRSLLLKAAKKLTELEGGFTASQLKELLKLPRSTISDWLRRLTAEGVLKVIEEGCGRKPTRYAYKPEELLPASPCKRIFALVDGEGQVELVHDCLSEGALRFCFYEYSRSGGVVVKARCGGSLLRLRLLTNLSRKVRIGPPPLPALGIEHASMKDEVVEVRMRALGGAAYSLVKAMPAARGVMEVKRRVGGGEALGYLRVKALRYVAMGVDDTDSREEGATWALALSLLKSLPEEVKGVEPIAHRVVALNPFIEWRTTGNYASFIELGVPDGKLSELVERAAEIVERSSLSPNCSLAVSYRFTPTSSLRELGLKAKSSVVSVEEALAVAQGSGVEVAGGAGRRGVVGAVAALAYTDSEDWELLKHG